jgi:hypothetical protein
VSALARRAAHLHTTYNLIPGLSGLPERLRGKRLIMASAFEVYVDDSGSEPSSKIFFLAGFLSTVERWAAFSNEWDSALAMPPSLEYFKMSEAAGLSGQFSRKRGWDEQKVRDRLTIFARIINKYALLRASASIRYDLFEKYVQPLPSIERNLATDEPYIMLAWNLMTAAIMLADEKGLNEPIDFIFDRQIGHEVEFRVRYPEFKKAWLLTPRGRHLSRLIGEDPNFLDEKDRRPLQAADFYAWQARSHYMDNHRFPNQKIIVPMNPILKLFRGMPQKHYSMTEAILKEQLTHLVRVGEHLKKTNPSLRLIPLATDRKERKKVRLRARKNRKKN